ncbi:MAG: ferritin-like domain-containing protein [Bdellovibrionota bacterium]
MARLIDSLERFKVSVWVKVLWRLKPSARLEAIRRFEFTEDDSAWQLLRGAHVAKNPTEAAVLFSQAIEETKHAEEFRRLYADLSGKKVRRLSLERTALVTNPEDIDRLFAECAVGEASAAERFKALARSEFDPRMKRLLLRILADEAAHVTNAENQISENPQRSKTEKSIRRRRLKEAWLRSGRELTGSLSTLLVAIVYFALGGWFRGIARRRLGYGRSR